MHTTATARGEGVGEAMVKYLVGLVRQRGYERVSLASSVFMTLALQPFASA
ncbi:hypothetical protein BH24ACT6_BH24ACT6_05680 [soil metagenome]